MPFEFAQGFNITSAEPIDARIVMTKEQMLAAKKARMPEHYFCLCSDDNQIYVYDKSNTHDEEIGYFKLFKTELDEEAIQELINQSLVNFYDSKRKIADYLYEVEYSKLDYEIGKEYFENKNESIPSGACTSVRKGNFYGRNLDWTYDNNAEFIVKMQAGANRYASIGIASAISNLTNEVAELNEYNPIYNVLPFYTVDGINEKGVIVNVNVVPHDNPLNLGSTLDNPKETINAVMIPRYILDNCASADEAKAMFENDVAVVFSKKLLTLGYESHYMIADKNKTYILEFIDNEPVFTDVSENKPFMTNFFIASTTFNEDGSVMSPISGNAELVNQISPYGAGLERYNWILNNYNDLETSPEAMQDFMLNLYYSNAYTKDLASDDFWFTEFVGIDGLTSGMSAEDYRASTKIQNLPTVWAERDRNEAKVWHTTHSSVYDIQSRALYLDIQEQHQYHSYNFKIYFSDSNKEFLIEEIKGDLAVHGGEGIIINSNNEITYDPEIISTVEYVDANISDTMAYIIQEDRAEHAGRVAGDELLQTALNAENTRAKAEEAKKVDKQLSGINGEAHIFNEADGGGAKFVANNGIESFVGVNDGTNGIAAQIYADKLVDGSWVGAKLDVTNTGMYYTVGGASAAERDIAANEIAVKGDITAAISEIALSWGQLGQEN